MKKTIWRFIILVAVIAMPFSTQAQTPQETLNQYIADLQNNPDDYALREKIIKHVQTMKQKPVISEDARKYMVRGVAAVKNAKNQNDFKDAVAEFEKATLTAPWLDSAYYNLGITQDKAGMYPDAIKSFKLYLLASPNAADANNVKKLVYEIEYKHEKETKGVIGKDGRFIAYDNGTVLDTITNLMWAAKDNSSNINWQGAKNYCENYRGGGYTDWRMPTQDELVGLYDTGKTQQNEANPSYPLHLTELIDLTSFCLWASDTSGSMAANYLFTVGTRTWRPQSNVNDLLRALPVRSSK